MNGDVHQITIEQNHMGTTFELTVSGPKSSLEKNETALLLAHEIISQLENELSEFKTESEVNRFNSIKAQIPIKLKETTSRLLSIALKLEKITSGAYSPFTKSPKNIFLEPDRGVDFLSNGEIVKSHSDIYLEFGAIGKGYALDIISEYFLRSGIRNFCLSGGGSSIVVSGKATQSTYWPLAWSWSKDQDGCPLGVEMQYENEEPIALGISGFHEKGQHIKLKRPNSILSALVAHPNAALADALSTAVISSGWTDEMESLSTITDTAPGVAVIEDDHVPRWNSVFQTLIKAPFLISASLIGLTISSILSRFSLADDGMIDLSSLGVDDFNPYLLERNAAWILLPVVIIVLIIVHTKRVKILRRDRNPEDPT